MKYLRSLVIFFISLNINQVYGKNLDYFLKSNGDDYNYFIETSASFAVFQEEVSGSLFKTQKNSPMTISGGLTYFPDSVEKVAILLSGSISYLVSTDIEIEGQSTFKNSLKLDPETSAGLYVHKSYTYRNVTGFFGGIDHEFFYLYNAPDFISSSDDLKTENQKLTYTTLGLAFAQKFITPFVFKLSASQSIVTNSEIKGQRYLIEYSQKYSENMWYNVFIKRHELESDTREIKITRLGVGVGFYY